MAVGVSEQESGLVSVALLDLSTGSVVLNDGQ